MNNIIAVRRVGDYAVSNTGRVFSMKVGRILELKPNITKSGYARLRLYQNGSSKSLFSHRIVLSAFTGDEKDLFVNHRDGNKLNNHIENLEWCTHSENMKHAFDTGLAKSCEKRVRLKKYQVLEIMKLRDCGDSINCISVKLNLPRGTIMNVVSGRRWSYLTGLECTNMQKPKECKLQITDFYDDSEDVTAYGTKGHHDFDLVKKAVIDGYHGECNGLIDELIKDGHIIHTWYKSVPHPNGRVYSECKGSVRGAIPHTVWCIE